MLFLFRTLHSLTYPVCFPTSPSNQTTKSVSCLFSPEWHMHTQFFFFFHIYRRDSILFSTFQNETLILKMEKSCFLFMHHLWAFAKMMKWPHLISRSPLAVSLVFIDVRAAVCHVREVLRTASLYKSWYQQQSGLIYDIVQVFRNWTVSASST